MAKSQASKAGKGDRDKPKGRSPVVFVTLDHLTDAALAKFISSQRVPPERAAVGLMAIREFLTREGYKPGDE